jgi:hypothetical protein
MTEMGPRQGCRGAEPGIPPAGASPPQVSTYRGAEGFVDIGATGSGAVGPREVRWRDR